MCVVNVAVFVCALSFGCFVVVCCACLICFCVCRVCYCVICCLFDVTFTVFLFVVCGLVVPFTCCVVFVVYVAVCCF